MPWPPPRHGAPDGVALGGHAESAVDFPDVALVTRTNPDLPDRARYTEQQLAEILRRAAERQDEERPEAEARFSLAEIQQIAAEVGIARAHVVAAAGELARRPKRLRSAGVLGAPTSFRFEEWVDGELPTEAISDLFDIARQEFGVQGQVAEALDTVEWRGKAQLGGAAVTVTRRAGRTKIGVFVWRTDAAVVVTTCTSTAGVIGAFALGSVLVGGLAATPLTVLAAAAVSAGWAGMGTWLATRGIWRPLARHWNGRAAEVGARLVDAAQRALAVARIETE